MESQQPDKPRHPLDMPRNEAETYLSPIPKLPPPQPTTRRLEIPRSTALYTYIILGINVVVFLIDSLLDRQLTLWGGKWNPAIIDGEYWRLVTHMFLHGGLVHLGLNGYFLYIFGAEIERAFGPLRFLAIYFLSGLAGGVLSFIGNPDSLSVGASGALFGLIGAMLPLLYRNRHVIGNTQARMTSIVQTLVLNLIIGFIPGTRIDYWAHIGGLIVGVAVAWFTAPRYAIQLDLSGLPERVVDESSVQTSMVWYSLFGLGLVLIMSVLIWINIT